jgi:tryptophan 2,3-dioxygenase
MTVERSTEPFTYGTYLRVPELLELQTPLAEPPVPDEMLFIISQQAEELWFKQILFDLRIVLESLATNRISAAISLLGRINRIVRLLQSETEVLETLPPAEFHRFRGYLKAASGLESEQFRELEVAVGLRDAGFLKVVAKFIDLPAILGRWPVSLHEAFLATVLPLDRDPVAALLLLYASPDVRPDLYRLAEELSTFELRFAGWRFQHLQVVERVIGDRSPGTAGSPGSGYLGRTLGYRFFPELWEARNRLTSESNRKS